MKTIWQKLRSKNANPYISFKNQRRLIGILGMVLPLICFFGALPVLNWKLGPSISSYYYTNVRDVFAGILVAVAIFLIAYRGDEIIDNLITSITGYAGLGIALFPCFNKLADKVGFFQLDIQLSNVLHLICAGLFFSLLAMNSIFIFTLTDNPRKMTQNKRRRNVIYIVCGLIILLCVISMAILHLIYGQAVLDTKIWIFVIETIALEAFGVSWLVKGETILKDS